MHPESLIEGYDVVRCASEPTMALAGSGLEGVKSFSHSTSVHEKAESVADGTALPPHSVQHGGEPALAGRCYAALVALSSTSSMRRELVYGK